MRNIKLHFSIDESKKNKEFKLKTDKELTIQKNKNIINKILKNIQGGSEKNETFLNFFKKIVYQNNMNNSNKINYMKGSESKKYYQKHKGTM